MLHFLPLLILFCSTAVVAQDPARFSGARIRGMGDASVAVRDASAWSLNPASARSSDGLHHQFSVQRPFNLEGATAASAAVLIPVKKWMANAGVYRFGDGFHSQSAIMSGLTTEAGNTSAGIRMEFHQVRTEGYRTQVLLSWSAGSITRLGKKISMGITASGVAQAALQGSRQRVVPHFIAGIAVQPSENVLLAMDVHKRPDRPPGTVVGIEYMPVRNVWMRMGAGIRPEQLSAGLGFRLWKLNIDQAVRFSETLGWQVQATAGYRVHNGTKRRSP